MRGKFFWIVGILSLFITSCGTFIPVNQANNDYSPIQRSYYFESSIINKDLFAENKAKEPKREKKEEKSAIEEILEIQQSFTSAFVTNILSEAESFLGVPYRYGGTTRSGIDCSSFVQQVFSIFGQELPRVSQAQAKEGSRVTREELREGDLVFFATKGRGRVTHVGIVHNVSEDGEIDFIHASTSQGVTITPLNNSYWSPRYLYGKRIIN